MINRENILKSLSSFILPAANKSLADLHFIKACECDAQGSVHLQLELRAPHSKNKDFIQSKVLEILYAIPGVTQVKVDITEISSAAAKTPEPQDDLALLAGVKRIVAVASGKGGVGKSTVTANLAVALSKQGLRVGILDADIYGPSMNLMFGIKEAPKVNADKTVFPVSTEQGIRLISMAMFAESDQALIWRGPMASQMIRNFLSRVHWGQLDVLLLDMPPGTGDIQLTITQMAPLKGALIVTTPQEVSVLDARKGLRMFQSVNVPVLGVVENMSFFICDSCNKHHYIFESGGGETVARELGLAFLGEIPLEPAVAQGGDRGIPVVASQSGTYTPQIFSHLAENIWEILDDLDNLAPSLSSFDLSWEQIPVEDL